MTQNLEIIDVPVDANPAPPAPHPPAAPARSRSWWRRPWIAPLFLVSVAYVLHTALPYLDKKTAPLMPHEGFGLYYPFLIAHIAAATVAMMAAILQVWPWLRRRHRAVHRWNGRVYVLTTLAAGFLALTLVPFAPPVGQLGVTAATVLWLVFTVMGYVRIRQRRYAEHRRFMLYAFAMVMNNFWGSLLLRLGTEMELQIDTNYYLEASRWVGWIINLMLVQWWLNRTAGRPLESGSARSYSVVEHPPTA